MSLNSRLLPSNALYSTCPVRFQVLQGISDEVDGDPLMLAQVEEILVAGDDEVGLGGDLLVVLWPYGRILRRLGYSPWLSLLMFVPIANLVLLWIIAYAQWPVLSQPSGTAG